MTNLYTNTLPPNTAKLVSIFQASNPSFINNFYLSGGTALSLQLGHRESEDLDFFSLNNFDPLALQNELSLYGKLENTSIGKDTLNTELNGVKLQFLGYPYPQIENQVMFDKITLSSVLDIALTKLQTIGMRGSRKDFIDLYKIFDIYTLEFLLSKLPIKYNNVDYNLPHILKSLIYFEDAEQEPLPRLHQDINWNNLKSKIIDQVKLLKFA